MDDDNKQQDINTQQNPSDSEAGGRTVIQPSASFVEEMKASSAEPVQQPSAPPSTPNIVAPPQRAATVSSVYPKLDQGANNGPGSSAPTAPPIPSAAEPMVAAATHKNQGRSKVLVVQAVAGVIIALNAINFYDWYLEKRSGYTNWLGILEIIAMVALAIGIFKLSETARSLYVMLSAVWIVLSCVSFIMFYTSTQHKTTSSSATVASIENNIQFIERDTHLPAETRQQEVQQLQQEINRVSGSSTELKVKQYLSTAILLLTAVGPLVVLTRPAIKEAFNQAASH
jgi:hypothetical protein